MVPFEHQDVRVLVDSMFLDGTLHPVKVKASPAGIPGWAKIDIVRDPSALRDLVRDGVRNLLETMPDEASTHRDWSLFAKRFAEILARFHTLASAQAETVREVIRDVQRLSDQRLQGWVRRHYGALPSLPAARAPVMVHHVPRFLSMRRNNGETKVALVVMDGLALDQWVLIRDWLASHSPRFGFDEGTCFSWLPSLTSVSRQALFSGLLPRGFADAIETTAQEPSQWSRLWQDQGLRTSEVYYRKGIRRSDQLDELESALSGNNVKAAGIVVDTVDEIVHGAVLGKRGIAAQIASWFADRGAALFRAQPEVPIPALCWGMAISTYPFFGKVAELIGRLSALQGDCASAEVHRRMSELYGEREGTKRMTNMIIQTHAGWGALLRTDSGKRLVRQPSVPISDDDIVAWLIEAAVRYSGKGVSITTLQSMSVLYPFRLDRSLAYLVSNSPMLELRPEGPSSQFVAIRR